MSFDPIANMISMIKNAFRARHEKVDIPLSKIKLEMIKIFKNEGFIKNFKLVEENKQNIIRIFLKYNDKNVSVISDIKRVSKQGKRRYSKSKEIPRILNGLGVVIISTAKGVTTGKRARDEWNVGGEILCYIW
ncbi:MAG: 30S ribosomal protein S8 [Spirochaetota bacterium]|nr:30S ribosomal protein S8 [Spirochaetota bacterium]